MGTYLGYITQNERNNEPNAYFFNFEPIAEVKGSEIHDLKKEELENLLPDVRHRNINFIFNVETQTEKINSWLKKDSLLLFDFTREDLSINRPWSYTVPFIEVEDDNKIHRIGENGIYYVVRANIPFSDFHDSTTFEIDEPYILKDDEVFVQLEDRFAGPYKVKRTSDTSPCFIEPLSNLDTICEFNSVEDRLKVLSAKELSDYDRSWTVLVMPKDQSDDDPFIVEYEEDPQPVPQPEESQLISEQIEQLEQKVADLTDRRDALEQEIEKKTQALHSLKEDVKFSEIHKKNLENGNLALERQFLELTSKQHEKMLEITFDGFMSSKLLRAAAEWEREEMEQQHEDLVTKVNAVPVQDKAQEELIDYLCRTVQIVRPSYKRNTIINLAICITHGFLTVFSGEPGCGKTSICNILAEVLGLNKIPGLVDCSDALKDSVRRYIPVSIEKGWTSKRDFIGYFNPLSKTFDKSNRTVYDALHQLDSEARGGHCNFPYIILLDEANLSPMEYYWSDFMNICDDLGPRSEINLGENYVFRIPETLHFLATINNDHTTEDLSPRLIDRAWIVSLPQPDMKIAAKKAIPQDQIEIISWESLKDAFVFSEDVCELSNKVQGIYDSILKQLKEKRFTVNFRVDAAIKRYWATASRLFEAENEANAEIIALDYAVAQRLLPKILGYGEDFEEWLTKFRSLCSNHHLNMSAGMIQGIIDRGNQHMKYYKFFS